MDQVFWGAGALEGQALGRMPRRVGHSANRIQRVHLETRGGVDSHMSCQKTLQHGAKQPRARAAKLGLVDGQVDVHTASIDDRARLLDARIYGLELDRRHRIGLLRRVGRAQLRIQMQQLAQHLRAFRGRGVGQGMEVQLQVAQQTPCGLVLRNRGGGASQRGDQFHRRCTGADTES